MYKELDKIIIERSNLIDLQFNQELTNEQKQRLDYLTTLLRKNSEQELQESIKLITKKSSFWKLILSVFNKK